MLSTRLNIFEIKKKILFCQTRRIMGAVGVHDIFYSTVLGFASPLVVGKCHRLRFWLIIAIGTAVAWLIVVMVIVVTWEVSSFFVGGGLC